MVKFFTSHAAIATILIGAATATSVPDGTWPASTGAVKFTKPHIVKAGEVFDGKMQTFDRSDITCSGGEGQKDSAVFLVEAGGTLKNAIIGKNQKEGVHCDDHDCTIENVWWNDVCEDALSIKGGSASSVTTVTNCGARYASDKVVQHNGYGTVKINGFFAQEFGKLFRSCGTCGNIPRTVTVENVYAIDPLVSLVTVNKNYGDKATLKNIYVKTTDGSNDVKVCEWSQGSKTPSNLGDGPSGSLCQYAEADIHINEDVSQSSGPAKTGKQKTAAKPSAKKQTPTQTSPSSEKSSNSPDQLDDYEPGTVAPDSRDASQSEEQQGNDDSDEDPTQQTQQSSDVKPNKKKSENSKTKNEERTISSSKKSSSAKDNDSSRKENSDESPKQNSNDESPEQTSNDESPEQASNEESPTQQSSDESAEQTSKSGSSTKKSSSKSPKQTATNSTAGVPDGTWPASTGAVKFTKPHIIKAGEVFDGKMQTFDRSDITCSGGEGQKDTAVFLVEAGGTLKNAIIGKNQKEGVHCDAHDCTIENVWWDDVCEDALSIKGGSASSVTTVTNCGARYASDKVVQHNGYGTVKINGFFVQEFGKLFRSCGTCGNIPRTVTVENVYAIDPLVSLVTVNKNYGDKATLKNIYVKTTDGSNDVKVCEWSQGSKTPSNLGDGPSGSLCLYAESDIHINEQ